MNRILIVSKTKMLNNRVCVGGIDLDNKISVRLMDINGSHESAASCPYNIREIWDVEYSRGKQRPLPHSEDIRVVKKCKSGVLEGEKLMLALLNEMQFHVYEDDIFNTFEGKLKYTEKGSFYISDDAVPNHSTCFWICDRKILRGDYKEKIRYNYLDTKRRWGFNFTYVGLEDNPSDFIRRGTLVRLSLAHWWKPEDADIEERCYLQLSGWYEELKVES